MQTTHQNACACEQDFCKVLTKTYSCSTHAACFLHLMQHIMCKMRIWLQCVDSAYILTTCRQHTYIMQVISCTCAAYEHSEEIAKAVCHIYVRYSIKMSLPHTKGTTQPHLSLYYLTTIPTSESDKMYYT